MNILLVAHVGGAIGLAGVMVAAVAALFGKREKMQRRLAKVIGLGTMVQVISGSALAIAVHSPLGRYCVQMGVYLGVTAVVEGLLVLKLRLQAREAKVANLSLLTIQSD